MTQALNLLISICFVVLGYFINKAAKEAILRRTLNARTDSLLNQALGESSMERAEQTADLANRNLAKMWIIIIELLLTNLYCYLYSQILFFTPKDNTIPCTFFSNTFVYNLNSTLERFIQYVVWTLPIIYVFWPMNRTWYGTIKC